MLAPILLGLFLITGVDIASPAGNSSLRLLIASDRQVVIEFAPESVGLAPDRSSVFISGTEPLALPGEPDLPGIRLLVGCPQTGTVRLQTIAEPVKEFYDVRLRPAPALNEQPVVPGTAFQQNRFFPEAWAVIETIETVRTIRVARLRLNPAQFNPVLGRLRVARIRVVIDFSTPAQPVFRPDPLDSILARTLVNGAQAVNWKNPLPTADSINFFNRFDVWCQVRVETTGIYQITPADLRSAGFNPNLIDPRTFRLYTLGPCPLNGPYPDTMIELPLYVSGAEDGVFNPEDLILFYAQAPSCWNDSLTRWQENYYTRHRTLWLTWGRGAGKRMPELAATAVSPLNRARNKVRVEQDLLCPARGGLLWVWERFNEPDKKSYIPFTLPNRDTLKSLTVRFYAKSETPSATVHAVLSLNRFPLDTITIRAQSQACPANTFVFESLPLAAAAPTARTDTLGFELIGAGDVYLDYLEVDYITRLELTLDQPELEFYTPGPVELNLGGADQTTVLLDVTSPWNPVRITGITGRELRFQAPAPFNHFFCARRSAFRKPVLLPRTPGQLRTPAEAADYYIICPDEFLAAARLLAQYRDRNIPGIENGRARAVPLSSIYDDYAFGMQAPGAIKAFLTAKRPAYGLLLGDATYDYKDNLKIAPPPGVPAYEIGFDLDYEVYNPHVKALDAWYADFDGEGSGPDMILTRLTARSPVEVRRFLDKLRFYETQPLGFWARRFLLLGDDEYQGSLNRPESFVHILGCEGIAPLATDRLELEKIYLTEYRLEGTVKPRANAELIRQLNAGALLWCFFGHGSGFQLCHERAFHINDVPTVHNQGRLPVAFFGSCGVGRFDDTRYEAIAEELVRAPEGCIATIGASKATYSSGNEVFARVFFTKLLSQPELPLGAAFYPAWLTSSGNLYILFGDPLTRVRLPEATLPITVSPDTIKPGGFINWSLLPGFAGFYSLRASEAPRNRFYQSDVGTITYILPGPDIFRLEGRFQDSLGGSFMVPRLAFPDTVFVDNGWFARIRESCQVRGLVWNENSALVFNSRPLYLSPELLPANDREPPNVLLFADNVRLLPGDTTRVPKRFRLNGGLTDPSGILLLPGQTYSLSLYLNERSALVSLLDYFHYDDNQGSSGSFNFPLELEQEKDSLFFICADNCLNGRVLVHYLKTDLREELRLDSCLVYPNPASNRAYFTFILSRPATVTVKIYTISGRLLRTIGPQQCHFGYNQIEWDTRDRDGNALANGVYLYKIDARTDETAGSSVHTRTTSHRDKLLIRN